SVDSHAGAAPNVQSAPLALTAQSRLNLGLTDDYLKPIELTTYSRSITVPAVIVPKPGRSQIVVASPLNGVVTHVHAVTGEAVMPGELLFEIRLTYEDLVETQTLYLKTLSELEVENREIVRLEQATQSGAISGKSLLDRRYAKDKLEAHLRSLREALRLHGLSDRQVDAIGQDGKLLRDLKVVAPDIDRHDENEELRLSQNPYRPVSLTSSGMAVSPESENHKPLVIEELQVHKGQAVVAGEKLCSLSDYAELFIEGKAFEQDVPAIAQAAQQGWPVDAVFPGDAGGTRVTGLELAFVGNSIDADSRTLSFFVELKNQVMRDEKNSDGQRYLSWKYRVGQRLELQVPVEQWENQIVVPVDAVVKEGADWFVFQQNGASFTRVPVHLKHRDQSSAVIANDGSIFPGDVIALKSAHQMQMAIKNKSGGGADPHAGHNH
ncbi:MAG TPA: efflux RND transporter periplasmic adaptor subunit, partial [Pirellulaceae bacterium]|nr:efflux RND transporter periplasmic adaptor subunit [Pirellulaceae bacterium]